MLFRHICCRLPPVVLMSNNHPKKKTASLAVILWGGFFYIIEIQKHVSFDCCITKNFCLKVFQFYSYLYNKKSPTNFSEGILVLGGLSLGGFFN